MTILNVYPSCLNGQITISGAKNSALRLLAASLLTSERLVISNYPASLSDCKIHVEMLELLGKRCSIIDENTISIEENGTLLPELHWYGRSIRNTLLILGVLTARNGHGSVPLPGGCQLGERLFDIHEHVLTEFGAEVWQENGQLKTFVPGGKLKGKEISLRIL